MAWLRHPRLALVLGSALLVAVLRAAAYDEPGHPLQVAMQAVMWVPVAAGLAVCALRVRQGASWLTPAAGFLAAVPAVLYAWSKPPEGAPGDESCSAKGFLPFEWRDAMEEAIFYGVLWLVPVLLVVGLVLAARKPTRWQGLWTLAAAFVVLVEWYAAPVCVGT